MLNISLEAQIIKVATSFAEGLSEFYCSARVLCLWVSTLLCFGFIFLLPFVVGGQPFVSTPGHFDNGLDLRWHGNEAFIVSTQVGNYFPYIQFFSSKQLCNSNNKRASRIIISKFVTPRSARKFEFLRANLFDQYDKLGCLVRHDKFYGQYSGSKIDTTFYETWQISYKKDYVEARCFNKMASYFKRFNDNVFDSAQHEIGYRFFYDADDRLSKIYSLYPHDSVVDSLRILKSSADEKHYFVGGVSDTIRTYLWHISSIKDMHEFNRLFPSIASSERESGYVKQMKFPLKCYTVAQGSNGFSRYQGSVCFDASDCYCLYYFFNIENEHGDPDVERFRFIKHTPERIDYSISINRERGSETCQFLQRHKMSLAFNTYTFCSSVAGFHGTQLSPMFRCVLTKKMRPVYIKNLGSGYKSTFKSKKAPLD